MEQWPLPVSIFYNWGTEKAKYSLLSTGYKIQSVQHQALNHLSKPLCAIICNSITSQKYFETGILGEEGGGIGGKYLESDWGSGITSSWRYNSYLHRYSGPMYMSQGS